MLKKKLLFILGGVVILLAIVFISSNFSSSFAYNDSGETLDFYPVQNDEKLELVDGVYQLDLIEKLFVRYKLNKYDKDKYYFLEIYKNEEYFNGVYIDFKYSLDDDVVIDVNNDSDITSFKAILYSSSKDFSDGFDNEDIVVEVEKEFKVKFNKFDYVNFDDTRLNIVEIRQAGKVIEPLYDEYYNSMHYNVKNSQEYELVLKGENFVDDIEYNLFNIFHVASEKVYTGRELNEGISITIGNGCFDDITNKSCFGDNYSNNFGLKGFLLDKTITYKDSEGNYYDVYIDNYPGDKYFYYKFLYTNYEDIEINNYILGKYHDKDNSLSIDIMGKDFVNDDIYDVDIKIYKNKEKVYEKTVSDIDGNSLNNGYRVELDNFVAELSNNLDDASNQYYVTVKIDYMTINNYFYYLEERARLNASVFNADGSRIAPNKGSGEEIGTVAGYTTGNELLLSSNKLFVHVLGDGFIDEEDYDYKVLLCNKNYKEIFSYDEGCTKSIYDGKITGKLLNDKGIVVPINSSDNNYYDNTSYVVAIYRDGKVIQFNDYMFDFTDEAIINFTYLKSNNKNLYMDMRESLYGYTVIKGSPLDVYVRGFNYELDKNYNILLNLCYTVETLDGKGQECSETKSYTFSGLELNAGTAVIKYEDEIDYSYSNYEFIIREEDGWTSSFVGLKFVDSGSFLPSNSKYKIDGVNYLIKGIKANTDIDSFSKNFVLGSDERLKILNSDLEEVESDYVGTGMISSITDEYDRSLLNLDVVVKGDVSGDGRITITDLVKMKKHLAKVKSLDGLYERAGRIIDGEKIGITDLVKVAKDVAKIEAIN